MRSTSTKVACLDQHLHQLGNRGPTGLIGRVKAEDGGKDQASPIITGLDIGLIPAATDHGFDGIKLIRRNRICKRGIRRPIPLRRNANAIARLVPIAIAQINRCKLAPVRMASTPYQVGFSVTNAKVVKSVGRFDPGFLRFVGGHAVNNANRPRLIFESASTATEVGGNFAFPIARRLVHMVNQFDGSVGVVGDPHELCRQLAEFCRCRFLRPHVSI
jgi:hypothetical protein